MITKQLTDEHRASCRLQALQLAHDMVKFNEWQPYQVSEVAEIYFEFLMRDEAKRSQD